MHQISRVGPGHTTQGAHTIAMNDSPPSSLMIHTPLNRAALVGNEIVVTGQEQLGKAPGVVPEKHLTDEGKGMLHKIFGTLI